MIILEKRGVSWDFTPEKGETDGYSFSQESGQKE